MAQRMIPINGALATAAGGTFEEVAELGAAFAEEVAYTASRINATAPERALWSESVTINAAADPDEYQERPPTPLRTERPGLEDPSNIPAEIMLLGLDNLMLVCQPAEVFAETAIALKAQLHALGYATPALVTYANGYLLYLPEPEAFPEGGYEVQWACLAGVEPTISAPFPRGDRTHFAPPRAGHE